MKKGNIIFRKKEIPNFSLTLSLVTSTNIDPRQPKNQENYKKKKKKSKDQKKGEKLDGSCGDHS